ncbi:N-acetyltransferase [uncultured Bifidobacterium sp.]|uniref:N-acetyltransferase n=1 Tax=uncultured Bifidobacterium sp. TaxID=165187 RepID=UPI00262F5050|nr:N-acetyltransferase [uncultured Bifidobacterium sp.]
MTMVSDDGLSVVDTTIPDVTTADAPPSGASSSGVFLRRAMRADLPRMMDVYVRARKVMMEVGNPTQWGTRYPLAEVVAEDVRRGRALLLVEGVDGEGGSGPEGVHDRILAQFAICAGSDPSYTSIDGAWIDDDPYVTIHRLASSGIRHGSARHCLMWAVRRYGNVRVDTHRNNGPMLHVLAESGFTRCGVITTVGGRRDPRRVAFQRHDAIIVV